MRQRGTPVVSATVGVLFLLLSGCSGPSLAGPSLAGPSLSGRSGPPAEATTFGDIPAAIPDPSPRAATEGIVLRVKRNLAVYDSPGGVGFATLPATQLDNPTWVPVIAELDGWARVLLPSRPNSTTGWVDLRDRASAEKARTPYLVDVDVDARRMVVSEDGRRLGAWTVGVGATESPTPRGRTFIMASIEETVSRFSPVILPLGTHSQTFNTYGGGPGTVALHGWPDPSVFGRAASDGCVRVPPDALRLLTSLPLGTLVLLR